MGKYNYDKSVLSGLGVGAFLGEVKLREKHIEEADATAPQSIFNANILAKKLHPSHQFAVVKDVKDLGSAKEYTLIPDKDKGTEQLAYFRAGQYIAIAIELDNTWITRPYTLAGSPKDALGKNSQYKILIKRVEGGQATNYILDNWKKGSEVLISGPIGQYYYTDLRDAKHVVALAGGSGITPFASMAAAIADGTENFDLTILYGCRKKDEIYWKDELESFAEKSKGKVKIVYVISDEEVKDYEHGFITANIIKKHAQSQDYTLYVSGPPLMMSFAKKEIEKLDVPQRRVRFEMPGETPNPDNVEELKYADKDAKHKVKVHVKDEVFEFDIDERTSILRSLEENGIMAPADCRSGRCGWCRSRLINGDVVVKKDDARRAADKANGWIYTCSSYAKSDIEIEVFPLV